MDSRCRERTYRPRSSCNNKQPSCPTSPLAAIVVGSLARAVRAPPRAAAHKLPSIRFFSQTNRITQVNPRCASINGSKASCRMLWHPASILGILKHPRASWGIGAAVSIREHPASIQRASSEHPRAPPADALYFGRKGLILDHYLYMYD